MKPLLLSFLAFLIFNCSTSTEQAPSATRPDIEALITLSQSMEATRYDSALILAKRAYSLSAEYLYDKGIALSALACAKILYQMGDFALSTNYLNESLRIYQELGNVPGQIEVSLLQSQIYMRTENFDLARNYLNEAATLSQRSGNLKKLAEINGSMGHLFEKTLDYDSALFYQNLALRFYSTNNDTLGLATIHDNIGSVYEDLQNFDEAYFHFQMALHLNTSLGNQEQVVVNTNNIGDIYRKKGDLRNALIHSLKALELAERAHLDYQIKSASRDLSKIHFLLKDNEKGSFYLEKAYEMTDALFSSEIASQIAQTRSIYELEQKQQQIALLEKEHFFDKTLNRILGLVATGFFLLGTLIIYQLRTRNQKNRLLLEAEARLAKTALENTQLNEQKLKALLENKQLREDQLHQEIELKGKSLTNSALHMIQKNEFLQDIRAKLSDLKKSSPDKVEKKVKRLIKSIDLNFSLDEDWQEFESIFEQVHSDFYKKLKMLYPDLSASEVRLCAMIRLNLQSKDMAAIMGISHDSLRIARYRLRKHLGLSKGSNLYSFLVNVA